MEYFLIAGEASGDLHGAALMREIKKLDRTANFTFLGGDLMQSEGGKMLIHYRKMAFMGIVPVILNIRTIFNNFKIFENELKNHKPNLLILIDYPGFNLKAAKKAKELGIPVAYYISPKIWAWKTHRIKQIKAYVDKMYTIFPFETAFYESFDYPVEYVGNPVADLIQNEQSKVLDEEGFRSKNQLDSRKIIALLPGSRKSEISLLLPEMEKVALHFQQYQFVVAGTNAVSSNLYQEHLTIKLPIVYDQTYTLVRCSSAAIVASGTATLETALLGTPQVVVYKFNLGWIMETLKPYVLKQRFFSLVNLVAEKEVVKELFQSQVNEQYLSDELHNLLENKEYIEQIKQEYSIISNKLQSMGAAANAAQSIVNYSKEVKS